MSDNNLASLQGVVKDGSASIYDHACNPTSLIVAADAGLDRGPKWPPTPPQPWKEFLPEPITPSQSPVPSAMTLSDTEAHRLTEHNQHFLRTMLSINVKHA